MHKRLKQIGFSFFIAVVLTGVFWLVAFKLVLTPETNNQMLFSLIEPVFKPCEGKELCFREYKWNGYATLLAPIAFFGLFYTLSRIVSRKMIL